MSNRRVNLNPTARALTGFDDSLSAVQGVGGGYLAQPIRPDDYDDSHRFDRRRNADDRPPLDHDPHLIMGR